jgi:nickel-dependent lactate racemase
MIELPYGRAPYCLDLAGRDVGILQAAKLPAPPALDLLLHQALAAPVAGPALQTLVRPRARVTIILSDSTRDEPRATFLAALRHELPAVELTIAIATGTHGPCRLDDLEIPPDLFGGARIINHDGHRDDDLVSLGHTQRGTPIVVHRCVIDADLVIATGCIRPHYFAGFGAGVKAVFPGLGQAIAIRQNHQLKTAPGARAGIIEGNPCRDDLEDAVAHLPTPLVLVNGVCDPSDAVQRVVFGEPGPTFRAGVALARPWFTVRGRRAPLVIASDALPVTSSLYQSAKIAAAVAPLVEPKGALVLVAECADGIEPVETVNEAIFRIGVLPRLAEDVTLYLVSSLDERTVARTLLSYAPSVASVVDRHSGPILVIPRASRLLWE